MKGHVRGGQFNTRQVALKLNNCVVWREKEDLIWGKREKSSLREKKKKKVKRSLKCALSREKFSLILAARLTPPLGYL